MCGPWHEHGPEHEVRGLRDSPSRTRPRLWSGRGLPREEGPGCRGLSELSAVTAAPVNDRTCLRSR